MMSYAALVQIQDKGMIIMRACECDKTWNNYVLIMAMQILHLYLNQYNYRKYEF